MMFHVLVGANMMQATQWCDHRLIHRSEIGRKVFSTRIHRSDLLRGRRGVVFEEVWLEDDGREFALQLSSREYDFLRMVRVINHYRLDRVNQSR